MRNAMPVDKTYRRGKAIEILGHVANGHRIKSAALKAYVNHRTAAHYLDDLRVELQAENIAHAVYIASKKNLI